VIVTFPTVEDDEILDALAAGADDYTIEPVNPDDLLERVVVGQRALKLAPWASDDDSDVQARPYRDALTGLATRDCFLKRLREELRRARRERAPLAIAMIDLDGFRRVNEVYGRSVGDEILRQLGKMLADGVRQGTDLAARYGGEEFAVIVPNTNMIGAKAMADRLRKEALLIRVCTERGCVAVAASVGVAVFGRRFWGLDDPVGALIEAAQRRLYQAKLQGGNCMAA